MHIFEKNRDKINIKIKMFLVANIFFCI